MVVTCNKIETDVFMCLCVYLLTVRINTIMSHLFYRFPVLVYTVSYYILSGICIFLQIEVSVILFFV